MALQKQETTNRSMAPVQPPIQPSMKPADVQRLQGEAKALVSEFQEKLQQTLHLFKLKAAKQVANELPGLAGKMLEQFTHDYKKLARETAEQLRTDLDAARQEAGLEASKQIAEIREGALDGFMAEAKASFEKTLGQSAELLKDQSQILAQSAEDTERKIESAAAEAAIRLKEAGEQIESSFNTEYKKRHTEMVAAGQNADAALRLIEAATADATTKLRATSEQIESSINTEYKKRHTELVAAGQNADTALRLIEAATAEATAKLQAGREQMEASLQAALQKHLADIGVSSANADTAMRAVQSAAGDAAAKLWAAGEQMESSLAAEYKKRADQFTAAGLSDLAHKAQVSIDGFEAQLEDALGAFKRKATARIDEDIAKATAGLLERSAGQLQQQTDEVRERLLADLRDSGSGVLEDTRRQMKKIEKATSEVLHEAARAAAEKAVSQAASDVEEQAQAAISRSAELAVSKITAAQKTLQTQAELSLTDHQRQVGAVSTTGLESVQRKLDAQLEAFRNQVEQRCEAERVKFLADLKDSEAAALEEIRRNLSKVEKSSSEIMQEAARGAAEKAVSQAVKKAEEQAQTAISRSADQAVSKLGAEQKTLRTQAEASVQDHQEQLAAALAASAETAQQKLNLQLEAFEKKLQAAAGTLEKKILESSERDFPRIAAQLAEAAAGEMEKKAGQAARQVEEKIQASTADLAERACRQASAEAENTFRSMRESAMEQTRSQMQQLFKEIASTARAQFDSEIEQSARKQRRSAQTQIEDMSRASLERLKAIEPQAVAAPARASRPAQYLLVLVALIPTVLFLYLANRPIMRLAPNAPADFVAASPDLAGAHPDTAQKVAQAYWDWAAAHLTSDYPYGSRLPEQPPALFDAEGPGFPTGVDADVARSRYWQKLRQLWTNPQSWQKVQVWNRH